MRLGSRAVVAIAVLVGVTVAACDDGREPDLATYCDEYRALADNNPFVTLEVASPGEMETAVDDLARAAGAIADAAPDDLARPASEYLAAVDSVRDLLDDAGYDPRYLDTAAYRRATIAYAEAATTLSNETEARCDA